MTHIRFPSPSGSIILPTASRAASLAGIASWSACRPRARMVRAAGWWLVRAVGPSWLPLPRDPWVPSIGGEHWQSLMAAVGVLLGPIEAVSIYEPPQTDRQGFAMLAVGHDGPVGFIKIRPAGETLPEEGAMTALSSATTVDVPRFVGAGEVGDLSYLVTTAFPSRLHRPPAPDRIPEIADEISALLKATPRESSIPDDWKPMHGDFAPWNLREMRGVGLLLFDFEQVGWAPPMSDLVFYSAACLALGLAGPRMEGDRDLRPAIAYWTERFSERADGGRRDQRLLVGMIRGLETISSRELN